MGAEFQIATKEGDILMYKMTFGNETSYSKYEINKTVENSSSFVVYYNGYFAENLTGFNETDIAYTNSTITGNISEDLFGMEKMFTLILPVDTNFSASRNEFQKYFNDMSEEITVEFSIGAYGYSVNIAFYMRVVVLIKVVEFTYYFSTTGVLLLGDFYFKDPTSTSESTGKFEILPEYSTISGADENPFNPANISVSNSTSDEGFDDYKKFQMDTKAIITIVLGSLGFLGLAALLTSLIRRNRKLN